mgnify:CR=1 FL=1
MKIDSSHCKPKAGRDIVHRWECNPIFDITDLDFRSSDILNAGVICFKDEILLLVTIEHLAGKRCIHLAKPTNGSFRVEKEPFLKPSQQPEYKKHESNGVLDARVTFLEGVYYITYIAFGVHGYRLALAKTDDFKSVDRIGLISEPDTKTGVLFPRRINGRYARLERPREGHSIWVSYSDDLIYWGSSELIISPRDGFWDANRIGAGSVPMEIDEGWLVLYYGAKDTSAGSIYRIGAVILDKDNPAKVIGRAGIPILSPREKYERIGDVPNIVFSTGACINEKREINIFYGAANSCICVGTTTIKEIVSICMEKGEDF